uniref:Si:dkey-28n18.9 n=1 Tax=Maylandia zebra TaxID=106582 RepID=A0A3P9BIP3_9CICH
EEVKETASVLSVHDDSIKVTEVLKDGDTLTFIIVSQKLSGTGEYHVDRTYEDFEWLQQHLFSQGDVPGIQGVIVSTCYSLMYLLAGFLALGECQPYCKALETFLQQVAAHSILSKNKAVEVFLTSSDPPGRQKVKKNIFNRLSQAVEEMRKEGHKDVDEFFQNERDHNLVLTGCTKTAAEVRRSPIASRSHHKQQCTCALPHRVFVCGQKNMTSVAENNVNTLGLGLDLESRYQEAEREMLFRRTCKLVELENAQRNVEKAKPVKKAMEEVKKAAETEFEHTSGVAKQEVKSTINNCIPHFHVSFHSGLVC